MELISVLCTGTAIVTLAVSFVVDDESTKNDLLEFSLGFAVLGLIAVI